MSADEIVPDTKNWTWVLDEACPECGFDTRTLPATEVAGQVPLWVERWVAVLAGPAELVRERPEPGVWSPLEYACHVRDAFDVFEGRVRAVLAGGGVDAVQFANWDQDATALEADYRSQAPALVSAELVAAGERVAAAFAGVPDPAWSWVGLRSDGSAFTLESLARYFAHDPVHHLHDVRDR